MTVAEKLREIEREFPVDKIKINNDNYWPLFRSFLYNQFLEGLIMIFPKGYNAIGQKLINATFKWWRWLSRTDYVFISNEMERKNEGEFVIDKLAEGVIRELGYNRSIYIEQVKEHHLKGKLYGKKRVVSFDLILILAGLYKKILKPGYKAKIQGKHIYHDIIEAHSLKGDYHELLDTFLSKVFVLQLIFRIKRPKAVFITDYGNLSVIFAAKKLDIPVIEFQHGLIGHEHPYYHPTQPLEAKFCPDFILVFGKNDVEGLSHGNYVPRQNVIPIGNYYLSNLAKKAANDEVLGILKGYDYSICVPTDFTTHEYLVGFICSVATSFPNCLFIISPRQSVDDDIRILKNVILNMKFSFQELVRHCDFNSCTNSTCSLEAISFGARNILIDEDGLASQFFGQVLIDKNVTRFAKSREDYIENLKSLMSMARPERKSSDPRIYVGNYEENLKKVTAILNGI